MKNGLRRIVLSCLLGIMSPITANASDLISFWDVPRHGANSFNVSPPDKAYFTALSATGAKWVRLTFSKWKGQGRDFLIGNADNYTGLVKTDLAILREVLKNAAASRLNVVIAPLSLPGTRWAQHNGGKYDDRIWSEPGFQKQAALFWRDLAAALNDIPNIAAFNIINEPAPEKQSGPKENASMTILKTWQSTQENTLRDLPGFYDTVISAIRSVDATTPIMVDSGWYANPRSLAAWSGPLSDERVLYAFHMYEPYAATSGGNLKRETPLRYPGAKTTYGGKKVTWNAQKVADHINTAFAWADAHHLATTRIVMSEFGCMRRWEDCGRYLQDVMDSTNQRRGHWAVYAFREDEWEGMDYELPASVPPGRFYWLTEQGRGDELPRNGPLMDLLKGGMAN